MILTKVRPTFSLPELKLLARGMEMLANQHIAAGDFNNPILLEMIRLKDYCESFKPAESKSKDSNLLADYIAKQTSSTAVASSDLAVLQPVTTVLTDDQRYDLLTLRDSSKWSDDELAFMNNVGFVIKMRRAGLAPVSEGDL